MRRFLRPLCLIISSALLLSFAGCSSDSKAKKVPKTAAATASAPAQAPTTAAKKEGIAGLPPFQATLPKFELIFPVMLGIDVLAADNFAPIAGKRIGLLTHPAGVNRFGVPTVEILRKAPNVKLVALFGPEHGIYGDIPAGENIPDTVDRRTGLPAYSLYGKHNKPTKEQLKGIDALVIDLQDIGVRSYTYNVCMKYAIEACFEHRVEVVVLDRPNPLGGLKVDGPILDKEWMHTGVGAYPIPYVHGLTIGEIARMAASTPGMLSVDENTRRQGRLTIIPMRGWRRSMRWSETGLRFTPTSPKIQDFPAVIGYAMTGLGCQLGGFTHGVGEQYPFRGISFNGLPTDTLLKELEALKIPGVAFRKITVTNKQNRQANGIYVEVTDWNAWRPTELSFQLMRLACKLTAGNPFAKANAVQARSFNIHTGSTEWWNALRRDGARVNVESFVAQWQQRAFMYQQQTRPFWLYN
ncbi:MAG: DUF1343 domain-containing protein [Nibricoccus sp.]